MNLISGSMDLVCRTCLIASNNMKSIFIGDDGDICKMLLACSGLPIHELDGFPTNICSDCLNKVYISYEFQQQCKISHKALINFMETNTNGKLKCDTEIESYNRFGLNTSYMVNENNSSIAVDVKIERVQESSEPDDFHNEILEKHNDPPIEDSIEEKYVISSGSDVFVINFKKDNDESNNECSNNIEDEISGYYKHTESEHNEVKLYQCFQCDQKFTRLDYLRRHRITHLNGKSYPCELCDRHFSRLDHKRRHMQKHLKIKPFKCDECHVAFTRADNLLAHRRKIHDMQTSPQPEVCEICHKTFPTLQNLNFHIKVHLPAVSNWLCKYCEQMFNSKEDRINHQNIMHVFSQPALNEWMCKLCEQKFDSKQDCKTHQNMMHSVHQPAIKEWACKFCELKFHLKQDRNNHQKMMHMSKEIYPCGQCDKRFTHLELKNRHLRQHLKVRPYKCDECGSRFTRRDNLGRHRENRHGKRENRNNARENRRETAVNTEIFEIFQ